MVSTAGKSLGFSTVLLLLLLMTASAITPHTSQTFSGQTITAGTISLGTGSSGNITFQRCTFTGTNTLVVTTAVVDGSTDWNITFVDCVHSQQLRVAAKFTGGGGINIIRCKLTVSSGNSLHLSTASSFTNAHFLLLESALTSSSGSSPLRVVSGSISHSQVDIIRSNTTISSGFTSSVWIGTNVEASTFVLDSCTFRSTIPNPSPTSNTDVIIMDAGTWTDTRFSLRNSRITGGDDGLDTRTLTLVRTSFSIVDNYFHNTDDTIVLRTSDSKVDAASNVTIANNVLKGDPPTSVNTFCNAPCGGLYIKNNKKGDGTPLVSKDFFSALDHSTINLITVDKNQCFFSIDCNPVYTLSVTGTAPNQCDCVCRQGLRFDLDYKCYRWHKHVTPTEELTPSSTVSQSSSRGSPSSTVPTPTSSISSSPSMSTSPPLTSTVSGHTPSPSRSQSHSASGSSSASPSFSSSRPTVSRSASRTPSLTRSASFSPSTTGGTHSSTATPPLTPSISQTDSPSQSKSKDTSSPTLSPLSTPSMPPSQSATISSTPTAGTPSPTATSVATPSRSSSSTRSRLTTSPSQSVPPTAPQSHSTTRATPSSTLTPSRGSPSATVTPTWTPSRGSLTGSLTPTLSPTDGSLTRSLTKTPTRSPSKSGDTITPTVSHRTRSGTRRTPTLSASPSYSFLQPMIIFDEDGAIVQSDMIAQNVTQVLHVRVGGGETFDLNAQHRGSNRKRALFIPQNAEKASDKTPTCLLNASFVAFHELDADEVLIYLNHTVLQQTRLKVLNRTYGVLNVEGSSDFRLMAEATLTFTLDQTCLSRRTRGLQFNVSFEPSSTPQPSQPVEGREPSEVLKGTKTGATVVAVAGGLGGSGTTGAQLSRSTMVLNMINCELSEEPLEVAEAPLAFPFNNSREAYYISGSFMNHVALLVVGGLQLLAALLYAKVKGTSFRSALHQLRCPSLMAFPVLLLLEPTAMCAVVTIAHGSPTAKALGIISALTSAAIPLATVLYLRKTFTAVFVPEWDDPVDVHVVMYFLFGNSKWIDGDVPTNTTSCTELSAAASMETGHECDDDFSGPVKGYVQKHRLLFQDYRRQFYLFLACEMTMSIVCGALDGIKLGAGNCGGLAIAAVVVFTLFLLLVLITRPFTAPFLMIFTTTLTTLQLLGAIFVTVRIYTGGKLYEEAAEWAAMICLYLLSGRAFYDVWPLFKKLYRQAKGLEKHVPKWQLRQSKSKPICFDEEKALDVELSERLLIDVADAARDENNETSSLSSEELCAGHLLDAILNSEDSESHNDRAGQDQIDDLERMLAEADAIEYSDAERQEVVALEALDQQDLLSVVADLLAERVLNPSLTREELSTLQDQQDFLRNVDLEDDDAKYTPGQDDELIELLGVIRGLEAVVLRQRLLQRKCNVLQGRSNTFKSRREAELDNILDGLDDDDAAPGKEERIDGSTEEEVGNSFINHRPMSILENSNLPSTTRDAPPTAAIEQKSNAFVSLPAAEEGVQRTPHSPTRSVSLELLLRSDSPSDDTSVGASSHLAPTQELSFTSESMMSGEEESPFSNSSFSSSTREERLQLL